MLKRGALRGLIWAAATAGVVTLRDRLVVAEQRGRVAQEPVASLPEIRQFDSMAAYRAIVTLFPDAARAADQVLGHRSDPVDMH